MNKQICSVLGAVIALGILAPVHATGQAGGETFTAKASVKSPKASASVDVTIRIDRFVADADREKIAAAIKRDGAATRKVLEAAPDLGYIAIGTRKTPIKYAAFRPMGDGRLITVVTAQPVAFIGGTAPDAKPKEGYDLAVALLTLDASGKGEGELVPAAKVKLTDEGALRTEDYGGNEVVRLTGIVRAAK